MPPTATPGGEGHGRGADAERAGHDGGYERGSREPVDPRAVLLSLAAGTSSLLNAGARTSGRGQDLAAAVRGDQLGQDRVGEQGYRGNMVLAHRVPQA